MSDFQSNITFGQQPIKVPTAQQRWQRFADRFVASVEDYVRDHGTKHCCTCQSYDCGSHNSPGECGCIDGLMQ